MRFALIAFTLVFFSSCASNESRRESRFAEVGDGESELCRELRRDRRFEERALRASNASTKTQHPRFGYGAGYSESESSDLTRSGGGLLRSTGSPDRDRYYDYNYRPSVGDHYVDGYFRSDGTYVQGHRRTNRDDSFWNNYSSYGNINPYTGRRGTRLPPSGGYSFGSTYVGGYFRSDGTYVQGHTRSR